MRALAPLILLAACATDATPSSTPNEVLPPPMSLAVGTMTAGDDVTLSARGADAGDWVWFAVGADTRTPKCPRFLLGACYEIQAPLVLGKAQAGRSGVAELVVTVPSTLPEGTLGYFQAIGLGASAGYASPVVRGLVEAPSDCRTIIGDFEAESDRIRSCTTARDCGTVLTGTSCGCTRDWVAQAGVDTTRFYDLLDEASSTCGYGPISTCDCPAVNGYACVRNECTWNYLP